MAQARASILQSPEVKIKFFSTAPAASGTGRTQQLEKRREPRYATCEPVDVYLRDRDNLHVTGILKNVSKNGMRIDLRIPMQPGDRIEVLLQNVAIIFAEVRYCRRSDACYQVGSVIEDVYYPRNPTSPRASSAVGIEITAETTQRIRFEAKPLADIPQRDDPAKNVSGFAESLHSADRDSLHQHVDRKGVDNLIGLRLPEPEVSLLERHMESCDRCLDFVLQTLEARESSACALPKSAPRERPHSGVLTMPAQRPNPEGGFRE